LDKLGLNVGELRYDPELPGYPEMPLTAKMLEEVKQYSSVIEIAPNIDNYPPDYPDSYLTIFPFVKGYNWTRDNFGPLWIPAKGSTVELTVENLPLYERIISTYESNKLEVKDGRIYINSEEAKTYTFKQDYYFMMGDNRHNSLDSRYWGFVPEDHIVGRPAVVWFSSDGNKKFPKNIRWKRFFKFV
jgi:signal peptidase I